MNNKKNKFKKNIKPEDKLQDSYVGKIPPELEPLAEVEDLRKIAKQYNLNPEVAENFTGIRPISEAIYNPQNKILTLNVEGKGINLLIKDIAHQQFLESQIQPTEQVVEKAKIKPKIPKGLQYLKIEGFSGSWGSGMGFLLGTDEKGNFKSIPCDNGQTVRALDAAFGDVISEGHTMNSTSIKGREIFYRTDDIGVLDGFIPIEEYDE